LFPVFEEREIEPFQYEKHGKIFKMSYYLAPEKIFDNPVEANGWAGRSYAMTVHSKNTVKKVENPQEDLGFAPWEIAWARSSPALALSIVEGAQPYNVVGPTLCSN
jgi:hypothetical protein